MNSPFDCAQGDRQTERSPRLTARLNDAVGQGSLYF